MSGVAAGEPALVCTGIGYIPWSADNGDTVYVKCYYSEDAAETIVSPNDIVTSHIHDFISWEQYSNVDTGTGCLEFHRHDRTTPLTYTLSSSNGLWYYNNNHDDADYSMWVSHCLQGRPVVRHLSKAAEYHLYHFRYGCTGERDLSAVHHHTDNQPKLHKHAFFKCDTCCRTSGEYQMPEKEGPNVPADVINWLYDFVDTTEDNSFPGQHFGVDFGFMKGSGYCKKDEEGRTITSIDGYRSYLLVIDRKTRYTWIFLTKTKHPPIKIFEQFLKEHGHPTAPHRTIRSDKGGELWGSQAFREVMLRHGYIMEPTAPQAPYQNGKAERPNLTFGKMVNSLLYNAGLGPEYWSFALLHAVYLKNRHIHCGTKQVPLTQYTGKRPNARRLRIFGCPVIVRNLGKKAAKLDLHTSAGRFLGYTATDKNILFIDSVTKRIKTATHVVFDEAGMTLPASELPPSAKILQQLGHATETQATNEPDQDNDIQDYQPNTEQPIMPIMPSQAIDHIASPPSDTTKPSVPKLPITAPAPIAHSHSIQIKYLSEYATLPSRATDGSVGYDLYSARTVTIEQNTRTCIPLDISIVPPRGTYGQIFSRSGLAAKHSVDVCAGTIDPDYTGNVQVLLENNGSQPYQVNVGDRVAQIIFIQTETPPVVQISHAPKSDRGENGFGNTGMKDIPSQTANSPSIPNDPTQNVHVIEDDRSTEPAIVHNLNDVQAGPNADAAENPSMPTENPVFEKPFELFFTGSPFNDTFEIEIPIKGNHPTLGILTNHCEYRQRLQVKDMALSTPGSRLKQWRTVIQNAYILKFHEFPIQSKEDLQHAISQVQKRKMLKAKFVIATDHSYGVHPLEGIMQIHFDQLNVIANHLEDIERERQEQRAKDNQVEPVICPLKEASNNHDATLPLAEPPPLIPDADLAQQFNMKQAMNLFWAIVAHEGLIAIGADVSNAFAEAPAPKAPLFLFIDDSFRDWWVNHLHNEPISKECNVVRVNKAIQGHPESPRLWEKHIDGILRELGLTPAVHEPCIYSGMFDNSRVLFLRQVDDFAVAATDRQVAKDLIDATNAKM
jgi:dUTP pyrophosphatase